MLWCCQWESVNYIGVSRGSQALLYSDLDLLSMIQLMFQMLELTGSHEYQSYIELVTYKTQR
jgi:hypothetical protein